MKAIRPKDISTGAKEPRRGVGLPSNGALRPSPPCIAPYTIEALLRRLGTPSQLGEAQKPEGRLRRPCGGQLSPVSTCAAHRSRQVAKDRGGTREWRPLRHELHSSPSGSIVKRPRGCTSAVGGSWEIVLVCAVNERRYIRREDRKAGSFPIAPPCGGYADSAGGVEIIHICGSRGPYPKHGCER